MTYASIGYKYYYTPYYPSYGLQAQMDYIKQALDDYNAAQGTKTDIDERHIYAYLVKAVRHAAVDYLRNEVKMREFREEALKNMSPFDTDYSDELEKDKLVYRMIAGLKPPADTIVEMKYLKEMKVNEFDNQLSARLLHG